MSLDADLVSGRASTIDVEKQKQDLFEESDFFLRWREYFAL